jgi:hypothetical protein
MRFAFPPYIYYMRSWGNLVGVKPGKRGSQDHLFSRHAQAGSMLSGSNRWTTNEDHRLHAGAQRSVDH